MFVPTGWQSFQGEMASLRISDTLRLPVTQGDELRIIPSYGHLHLIERGGPATEVERAKARAHPASLADAVVGVKYTAAVQTEGAAVDSFELLQTDADGGLPRGLQLDRRTGSVYGVPAEAGSRAFTVIARCQRPDRRAEQRFTITVKPRLQDFVASLPPAFGGRPYNAALTSGSLAVPVRMRLVAEPGSEPPPWLALEQPEPEHGGAAAWCLRGTPPDTSTATSARIVLEVAHSAGESADRLSLTLRILPRRLRELDADSHTLVLWDWQGQDGKMIADKARADPALTLSWVNMAGDTREHLPAWGGRYPWEPGGGEWGYTTSGESGPVADLRQCTDAWCVEAWFRVGDDQIAIDRYGRVFDFGHICGSFDSAEQGVWELCLSARNAPGGALTLAPAVTFQSSQHRWEQLGPWSYPDGRRAPEASCAVTDTEWHHVAWQYEYATDAHELLLDGTLIWRLACPDGRPLVNDREGHGQQFSVSTRPNGYSRYGGAFNFLGFGHWFGHVGDIRISDARRY